MADIALQPAPTHTPTPRRRLFAAFSFDIVSLVAAVLATGAPATAWLLVRTSLGRVDPSGNDAVIALAVGAAALPVWTAWQWRSLFAHGTSEGMHRAGAVVGPAEPIVYTGRRRRMWFLLHPVTVPGWLWVSLTLLIPGPYEIAVFPLAVTVLQVALTLTGCIVILVRPGMTPSHVRIARGRRWRRGA